MRIISRFAWIFLLMVMPAAVWAGTLYEGTGTATYRIDLGDLYDSCECVFTSQVYLKSDGTYHATVKPYKRFWINRFPGTSEYEAVEALCMTDQPPTPFSIWGDYDHGMLQNVTADNMGGTNWVISGIAGNISDEKIAGFNLVLEQVIHHSPPSYGVETDRKQFYAISLDNPNPPLTETMEVIGIAKDWEGNALTGILFRCEGATNVMFRKTGNDGVFQFIIDPIETMQSNGTTGKLAILEHTCAQGYNPYYMYYTNDSEFITAVLIPLDVTEFALLSYMWGVVEIKAPGSAVWTAATQGMPLDDGTRIRTQDGLANIILPNNKGGFSMNVFSEATISIGTHSPYKTFINAVKGEFGINKHVNGAGLEIETPRGAAGDHGTRFTLRVTNTQDVIEIADGSVWTCVDGSTTTNVHDAGKRVTVTDGGAVSETTLSAAELIALNNSFSNLNFLVSGYTAKEMVSDFSSGAEGWLADNSGCWSVSGGRYVMTGNRGNMSRYTRYNLPGYNDYSIEADVRKTQGDSATYVYGYGLYARCNASGTTFYEFNILEDGRFLIGRMENNNFTTLVAFTNATSLHTGFNTWNRLRLDVSGGQLDFFANDAWLVSIYDPGIAGGYPGLFAVDAAASTVPDTVQFDNVTITYQPRSTTAPGGYVKNDFDADGRSDLVVYNIQTGDWYIRQSSNGQLYSGGALQWGWSGALPASGDFDADGLTDISVYNVQTGDWYIRQSSNGQLFNGGAYQFGWAGALPAPGDFDGDGITDITVYNIQTGDWYVRQSSNGRLYNGGAYQFGWAGALPAPGDFDDDDLADFSVYNVQTGDWYIRQSGNGQLYSGGAYQFGWAGALPCQGDYDGDGITDIAVYNLQTGDWYILQSSDGQLMNGSAIQFGWSGAIPTYGN
jgi:hypothetical protein